MSEEKPTDEPKPSDEPKEPQEEATPTKPPLCPWNPSLTREDIERIIAEPGGMPLSAFRKMMGWG